MNSRVGGIIIGIGVLCGCTSQVPTADDLGLEQSALTFDVRREDDTSALKAVLFGIGRSELVGQFWDRDSLPMRSDPRYVKLAEALILEVTRRNPDLASDFDRAIRSGNPVAIDREIERAEDSIAEILGDRDSSDQGTTTTRTTPTLGGSGDR